MDRLKLMATYELVVRLGTYSAAARELGVTRALVSKRILELERVLNVRLLNRTTQRIGTTSEGADYYKGCVSVLADIRSMEERLVARRKYAKGELRILSSKTLGEIILAPILAQFCNDYPEVRPHLVLRDLGTEEHDLISRGFDLSIRPQDVKVTSLIAKPIISLPRVVVAAPSYIKRNGMPAAPADLLHHNCLTPHGKNECDWEFVGSKGRVTVRVSGSLKSTSNTVIRQATLRGVGISLLGEYVIESDIIAGRLITLLDGYIVPPRMLHVVYQKGRNLPLRTKLFIDYLSKHIKEWQQ
jgi:DNA-binding transcriptional LysR family regulator